MSTQSTKIDRTQTRFKEDCNRFDSPTKPKRNQKTDVPPETGHQSLNPGPWVTEIVLGLTEATEEQRESALAILESFYRLRPRYVTLRYPLNVVRGQPWEKELPATEFREETVLDNRSLCFGTAVREPKDESAPFKYVNQKDVLSGPELQHYLAGRQSIASYSRSLGDEEEHEREYEEETEEQEEIRLAGDSNAKSTKSYPVTVTDQQLRAAYVISRRWPTAENKETFWEAVHHFLSRETRLTPKDDDLHKLGLSDDFQMDFMLKLMESLERMHTKKKWMKTPADFIQRAWKNGRISEFKKQAKASRITLQIDTQRENKVGDMEDVNLGDIQGHKQWATVAEQHATVEQTKEEYEAECMRKHAALALKHPDLADVAGMFIFQQMTQAQIGKAKDKSQQAVSKDIKKYKKLIKTVPEKEQNA
jgi:hypothetical protein